MFYNIKNYILKALTRHSISIHGLVKLFLFLFFYIIEKNKPKGCPLDLFSHYYLGVLTPELETNSCALLLLVAII